MYLVFLFFCNLGKHCGKNLCLLNKYNSYCSLASALLYSLQVDSPKAINSKKNTLWSKTRVGPPLSSSAHKSQDGVSFSLGDTIFNKVPWPNTIFLNGNNDFFSSSSSLKFSVVWETQLMTWRISDWQSESDLDSIRNSCDVLLLLTVRLLGKAIRSSTREQPATNLHKFVHFHFSFLPFARVFLTLFQNISGQKEMVEYIHAVCTETCV